MWLWLWLWLLCNVKKHCHPCCLAIGVVVVARLGKPFQIPFQGKAIKKKKQCTSRLQLNRNAYFFCQRLIQAQGKEYREPFYQYNPLYFPYAGFQPFFQYLSAGFSSPAPAPFSSCYFSLPE